MSHRCDCPTRSDARYQAQMDFEWDGYRSYAPDQMRECPEASREYEDEMSHQRQLQEEEKTARHARERRLEEERYWQEEEERQQAEAEEERENEGRMNDLAERDRNTSAERKVG